MRRTIVLLATMALTLLVASGVALAVTKIGTDGPDTLMGTNKADNLVGLDGNYYAPLSIWPVLRWTSGGAGERTFLRSK